MPLHLTTQTLVSSGEASVRAQRKWLPVAVDAIVTLGSYRNSDKVQSYNQKTRLGYLLLRRISSFVLMLPAFTMSINRDKTQHLCLLSIFIEVSTAG